MSRNEFDPRKMAVATPGDKPAYIQVTFPAPLVESAGAGPVAGATVEEFVRLSLLPKELRDRVVLYVKEQLRR